MGMQLRPYQNEAVTAIRREWSEGKQRTLLVLPTGCHARGERLLMADGSTKAVEDIHKGDLLMGMDGTPRQVLVRHEGIAELYRVDPIKGTPFIVTGDHMLTLVRTAEAQVPRYPCEMRSGEIIDITVVDWLKLTHTQKHLHKLFRSGVIRQFYRSEQERPLDPYLLGILLGDGGLKYGVAVTTAEPEVVSLLCDTAAQYGMRLRSEPAGKARTYFLSGGDGQLRHRLHALGLMGKGSADKFVPEAYRTAPLEERLQTIAGLIDSDGYQTNKNFDFVSKSRQLAEDLVFMCRSVGLAAYMKPCVKRFRSFSNNYYRVSISGNTSMIPCRVARRIPEKRRQKKEVLRTGFTVTPVGMGAYVGFTVDGDNRYLLADFTVTHNCGKTIVMSEIARSTVDQGGRALIMAHRGELLTQAADKLRMVTGLESAVEKAESSSLGSMFPVTVGSVQSLCRERRLAQFPPDYFSTIMVDEAHHCLADSYQHVLRHFPDANVLGVTATPDKLLKKQMGKYFDSLAYEYTMRQAVKDKYLCPIKAQMIPLELNIRDVGVSEGDYRADDIGCALEPYLRQIADEMAACCHDRKTVVFLPLISTSRKFCEMLKERGFRAAEINGESADRAQILEDFDNGRYDVLTNSMLLTEGWDCPSVDCIVNLRPTKVRSLYQQIIGRGLRLFPGKEYLLVLDFLWQTERLDLCRPSSLVCKDEENAAKVNRMIEENAGPVDLIDAEEQAERDTISEREQSLAKQLAEMRFKSRKLVDPLQFALSIAAEDLADYTPSFMWEMAPPSKKQLDFLEKRGIFPGSVENMGKASLLIDRLMKRQEEGLSTPKQIRLLERYGFRYVGTWSFDAASQIISRLAARNWKLPYNFNPATYVPS